MFLHMAISLHFYMFCFSTLSFLCFMCTSKLQLTSPVEITYDFKTVRPVKNLQKFIPYALLPSSGESKVLQFLFQRSRHHLAMTPHIHHDY